MPAYDYASIAKVADPNVVKRIVEIGRQRNLSDDHIAAALATGIVESNLRNLSYGDRDSQGVFQQRPSQGWGSVAQVRNVDYAANKFYDTLTRTPRKGSLGSWAQAVQRSAHPERYDQALGAARQFLSAFGGGGGGRAAPQASADRPVVSSVLGRAGAQRVAEVRGMGFDARGRLMALMTAMSNQQRERAESEGAQGQSQPETAAEGLAASLAPPDEEFGQAQQALAPPEGGQTGFEQVAEEVDELALVDDDLDDDVAITVGNILSAGARNAAEAEEAQERAAQAEAEAAAAAPAAQAAAIARARDVAAPRGKWGAPSTAPFASRGLKPNALRAAQEMRQLGYAGTIHGVGSRKNPSDHPDGNATDFMTPYNREGFALGDGIAQHLIENRDRMGVKYVIWRQRIASASTGWKWRPMANRGSITANHEDHVHASYY